MENLLKRFSIIVFLFSTALLSSCGTSYNERIKEQRGTSYTSFAGEAMSICKGLGYNPSNMDYHKCINDYVYLKKNSFDDDIKFKIEATKYNM